MNPGILAVCAYIILHILAHQQGSCKTTCNVGASGGSVFHNQEAPPRTCSSPTPI